MKREMSLSCFVRFLRKITSLRRLRHMRKGIIKKRAQSNGGTGSTRLILENMILDQRIQELGYNC